MKRSLMIFLLGAVSFVSQGAAAWAYPQTLNLKRTLELAEKFSPQLKSEKYSSIAAEEEREAALSGYMPRIELQGLYTKGFPGSAGATDIGGLMVSPYHHGPSGGLFFKDTLWDFGRTSSKVRVARERLAVEHANEEVSQIQVDRLALGLLYSCARYRNLSELWNHLDDAAREVMNEVKRYVQTGQRSVVERDLAEAQYEEAITTLSDAESHYDTLKGRLAVVLGIGTAEVDCPRLENILPETERFTSSKSGKESPFITQATARVSVASAQVDQAKAEHMPYLVLVGSAGAMQATELEFEKKDWSAALGLHIPLFEGMKVIHEVHRSIAEQERRDLELEAAKLEVKEADLRYEELIRSAKVRMEHLENEVELARRALKTARKRYASLKGSVIDVREALRNLGRAETSRIDARAEYMNASVEKVLLKGGG